MLFPLVPLSLTGVSAWTATGAPGWLDAALLERLDDVAVSQADAAVQLEQRPAQRSHVDHRLSVRLLGARDGPANTSL